MRRERHVNTYKSTTVARQRGTFALRARRADCSSRTSNETRRRRTRRRVLTFGPTTAVRTNRCGRLIAKIAALLLLRLRKMLPERPQRRR